MSTNPNIKTSSSQVYNLITEIGIWTSYAGYLFVKVDLNIKPYNLNGFEQ